MDNCVFCNTEAVKESIYQTPNFYVRVGIGLIAPGHVLIIPKEHYPSIANIPEDLEPELEGLKSRVKKKVTEKCDTDSVLIEYGIWGQTVKHAHIQVVPSKTKDYEIASLIQEMVKPGGIDYEKTDMKGLREILEKEKGYVSIEEKGELWVCHIAGIAYDDKVLRNHLRYRKFFESKGLKGVGNWPDMSEGEKVLDEEKRDLTRRLLTG